MASETRSREARALAEDALVRFALLAGMHARDFVVIGGLNPDFLAPSAPAPHLGTTDVDILFELGFVYDRDDLDFRWLDDALEQGRFASLDSAGWRWTAPLGGAYVRLDLLCDVLDNPGQTVALPGATAAAVQNLRGPGVAIHDSIERALPVSPELQGEYGWPHPDVSLRFASLGGYLAAKSAALLQRRKSKDAYDLMFVALYNPHQIRGAVAAVAAMSDSPLREPARDVVLQAMEMFVDANGRWCGDFAEQMRQAGDDEPEENLREDAAAGARAFLTDAEWRLPRL